MILDHSGGPQAARAQLSADACAKRLGSLPCKETGDGHTHMFVAAEAPDRHDDEAVA